MRRTETVVIGGGQAGLAMSRCLVDAGVDHVVLERGRVAERWRSERWDSLRLLTPNWQSRLPGFRYDGPDPDGYMTMPEVVDFLDRYARSFRAPVEDGTNVLAVETSAGGYRVTTDRGEWESPTVVIATGHCETPLVPQLARELADDLVQVVPGDYRNPGQLPEGGVLVVGASAAGVQLAHEIHAAGRPVTLSIGRHTRLPRVYRGRDILWWLDAMGVLDESTQDVADLAASRRQPSLQLVGTPERATLDLPTLEARGVRLVGRALGAEDSRVSFADDLLAQTVAADARLALLLQRIDIFAALTGISAEVEPAEPFHPFRWPREAPTALDLREEGIRTVVWATGYRRRYPWLKVPVLDARGEIRHEGGVTPAPGLYVMGLYFLRRRKSTFIDGVGRDALDLSAHLTGFLRRAAWRSVSYDAVIVGARAAGAATAMLLARRGLRVLVVDRGVYGADTLSTHALMRAGVLQLARWGLLERLEAEGTPSVRRTVFHYDDEIVDVEVKPRDGVPALFAPRRTVLDRALVDAAVEAGAEVKYGIRVVDLVRASGGRVTGVVVQDEEGRRQLVPADVVVGADGIHSTIAVRVRAPLSREGRHATATVYGYWTGLDVDGYHWHWGSRAAAGVIPTNGGQVLVFVSVPAARFAAEMKADVRRGYRRILAEVAPELAARLDTAQLTGSLHGFAGQRGFLRKPWGPGWALVGDAAYFKDPLTAHGITDALRDAELLAVALREGGEPALRGYEATRDALSMRVFDVTDRIASFEWDRAELKALHKAFSEEMKREVAALVEQRMPPLPLRVTA